MSRERERDREGEYRARTTRKRAAAEGQAPIRKREDQGRWTSSVQMRERASVRSEREKETDTQEQRERLFKLRERELRSEGETQRERERRRDGGVRESVAGAESAETRQKQLAHSRALLSTPHASCGERLLEYTDLEVSEMEFAEVYSQGKKRVAPSKNTCPLSHLESGIVLASVTATHTSHTHWRRADYQEPIDSASDTRATLSKMVHSPADREEVWSQNVLNALGS